MVHFGGLEDKRCNAGEPPSSASRPSAEVRRSESFGTDDRPHAGRPKSGHPFLPI